MVDLPAENPDCCRQTVISCGPVGHGKDLTTILLVCSVCCVPNLLMWFTVSCCIEAESCMIVVRRR